MKDIITELKQINDEIQEEVSQNGVTIPTSLLKLLSDLDFFTSNVKDESNLAVEVLEKIKKHAQPGTQFYTWASTVLARIQGEKE